MSSGAIDMNRLSEALSTAMLTSRPNTSSSPLSRVSSFTYPLTRVKARTTKPLPPPSPIIRPVREEAANLAHGRVNPTFQLDSAPQNPAFWAKVPCLRLPAGVDPDEDGEEDGWDLDLVTLAVCTVDSVELIRRNTAEKKLRVGSCTSRSSKTVIRDAVRSVEGRVSNRVIRFVRRFSS